MDSRRLVDPELVPMLDSFPMMDTSAATLGDMRGLMAQMVDLIPTPDVPVETSQRMVPGPEGAPEIKVYLYRPAGVKGVLPAYYHVHGGGYVGGTPTMTDAQNRAMAHALQCQIVSVDYRFAPETPFPGAVEDCYAGLVWLYDNAAELGVDPKRIAIGGESAGGGLAAALGLVTRDRGKVPLVLQVLVYPMLDDRTSSVGEAHPYAGEFLWTAVSNRYGWASYLGHAPGGKDTPAYAAPSRATDLAGLPPTYIAVGTLDLFVDEDIDYAQRLIRAGVPTELRVYPGAFHGFDMAAGTRVANAFKADLLAAVGRALNG